MAWSAALFALGYALALGMGAYLYQAGAITIGTVYLFFQYTELLRRPLEHISDQLHEFQKASAGIERIASCVAIAPTVHRWRRAPHSRPARWRSSSTGVVRVRRRSDRTTEARSQTRMIGETMHTLSILPTSSVLSTPSSSSTTSPSRSRPAGAGPAWPHRQRQNHADAAAVPAVRPERRAASAWAAWICARRGWAELRQREWGLSRRMCSCSRPASAIT